VDNWLEYKIDKEGNVMEAPFQIICDTCIHDFTPSGFSRGLGINEAYHEVELEARLPLTLTEKGNVTIPTIKMRIPIIHKGDEDIEFLESGIKLALRKHGLEIK
jgi:hypothetical protein